MRTSSKTKLAVSIILFLLVMILPACAGAPAAEEPAAPAEPVEPSDQYPVQYGQDSRTEPFQHTDSKLKEMAASVAVLVHNQQVNASGNSVSLEGYTLNEMSKLGWLVNGTKAPMCSDELFTAQPAPGFCTGFLVGEDLLVTAGHCLQKVSCADTSIVFGFQMESDNSLAALTKDDVFKCAEVIAQETPSVNNHYLDYAIIRLDRATGRISLEYTGEDHLEAGDNVAVLGHPSGLPMKIASGAFVMRDETSEPFFVTNLDTFGSNSGSPVINTDSYQVEGILVRGEIDYTLSDDGSCVQVNRCPEGGATCTGENATKMSMLAEQIQEAKTASPKALNCFPNLLLVGILVVMARLRSK